MSDKPEKVKADDADFEGHKAHDPEKAHEPEKAEGDATDGEADFEGHRAWGPEKVHRVQ